MKRRLLILLAVALMLSACGSDYEIVCCKVVTGWLGGQDYACKTVGNDTGICPDSYPIWSGTLISPDRGGD